jgi:hypothetical protein
MDKRSIVLDFHLKGLSAHAIHEDPVAIFGARAVAYNMVTPYLREVKFGTAEVILDSESSSSCLDDCDRDILVSLEEKKNRFRPCEKLPETSILASCLL